jgi:hypothetical protein
VLSDVRHASVSTEQIDVLRPGPRGRVVGHRPEERVVEVSRPEKINALDMAIFKALSEVGERLKPAPGVRVVILSGVGTGFCETDVGHPGVDGDVNCFDHGLSISLLATSPREPHRSGPSGAD